MRDAVALAGFLGSSFGAAALGSVFTRAGLRVWYPALRKPAWTPSGRVIGAVWSVLYVLMALAAFLTWRRRTDRAGVRASLRWFATQLVLNVGWSALFFGARAPDWALLEIGVLWCAVAAWLRSAARVDGRVALLILPYLAWVTFAGALNAAVCRLNAVGR